jgi:hypothetical protein
MLRVTGVRQEEVQSLSLLASIPDGVRGKVMSFVGPRSILPLIIRRGGLEYQVVRKGGVVMITTNSITFSAHRITERIHGKIGFCLPDDITAISWIAQRMISVNNRFIEQMHGVSTVHIHFLGMEEFGMEIDQDRQCNPLNDDDRSNELFYHLEYDFSLLGTVSAFD